MLLFLTATIILSITPLQTLASGNTTAYQSGDLYYEIKLDHIEIVGCAESATEVIVPATIEELPVTVIAQNAFNGHMFLTSFTAPSTHLYTSVNGRFGTAASFRPLIFQEAQLQQ